jgi:hypothetical protein
MAGKGGTRSTTWKMGEQPVKKKGAKAKRTLIKEAIGLKNWEGFKSYLENEGATKLVEEMGKLKGRDYVMAFQAMTEFVKPKLARQEVKTEHSGTIALTDRPVIFK